MSFKSKIVWILVHFFEIASNWENNTWLYCYDFSTLLLW